MPTSPTPLKIVVLISGNGTNLQAIIDAIAKGLPAKICAVISNKPGAYGLQRAAQANIPHSVLSPNNFSSAYDYELALQKQVDRYHPDLIVLAGFMRVLSATTLHHWGTNRIINIHPSLLPKYRGLNTHQRVLDAKEKQHGVSVHFVTEDLDGGPVIAQMSLDILPEDTAQTLATRIQTLEHTLYPMVIDWFVHHRVQLIDGHVQLDGI
jgi:phosphoribosylglycinamide formyltransferase-1